MEICDPIHDLIIEAIIWNRTLPVNEKMVGKTVALYGFRLSKFNDQYSLCSTYLSQIKLL
jgi:hypothetical protein